jgi:hypothetical protein
LLHATGPRMVKQHPTSNPCASVPGCYTDVEPDLMGSPFLDLCPRGNAAFARTTCKEPTGGTTTA